MERHASTELTLEQLQQTWCNPLPLPDYPRGRACRDKSGEYGWLLGRKIDFRETADPSVIYHDGKWYLYPSAGMAYVSEDFCNWTHHRLEPYDCGYAPTVVVAAGRFYLTACGAPLYVADNPLGPFAEVGPMLTPAGQKLSNWYDPMLFADDDGQLYAYWGLGGEGIFGARLDARQPNRLATEPKVLFSFNPDHEWERFGDFNEDPSKSFVEGAWMFKHHGRYYLTYAAPGTEFKSYAMGAYVAQGPLGPFTYQARNPILRDTEGLIHGPGHGCIVRGPNDTLWAFYTHLVRNIHNFERRTGMDPAGIDDQGNLYVRGASETPQWKPGLKSRPDQGNDAGLLPVSVNKKAIVSSAAPGRDGAYAIDNTMRTCWQAAEGDAQPWILVDFVGEFDIASMRVLWCEPGLDYDAGVTPGPVRYRVEASRDSQNWTTIIDRTDNTQDMLIEYRVFEPLRATRARLTVTGCAAGIAPAITSLTFFGTGVPKPAQS